MVNCVVFDFDGTLVNSEYIKQLCINENVPTLWH